MLLLRRLSLLTIALVPALALAACGGDGDGLDTDYPSAGEDRFESTQATVQLELTAPGVSALPVALGALETVELEGPLLVKRGDPQDEDGDGKVEVPTEILEMALSGTASFGPVTVRESPDRESKGMVEQREPGQDAPADSFFDVFVEIDIEDITNFTVHNEEPLRMEATLTDLPPAEGDEYLDAQGRPLPIFTESGVEIGRVVDALHIPNPGPGPGPGPGGGSPEATPTETPEETPQETPTPEPSADQVLIDERVGCQHRGPGNSVVLKLMFLTLFATSSEGRSHDAPARPALFVSLAAEDGAAGFGGLPALGQGEPVVGATVTVTASGTGLLPGEESERAVTNSKGEARVEFGINKFGSYELEVVEVAAADGTRYQFHPDSNLSERFEVGQTCNPPEGW